ncbi:hypothetical protein Micbo1qcDRAFT_139663 [Microdochium bolleyi]|uniref:P-loop containing nucleoside triphosphate hydrolase protein n=1 Tax=Microdochium bolleyi TaxID=196109 RepID=A0A136IPJ9_9PEZI|nr:hypothetical protein Micbo1qcDRAFT_139663 [Microdochium bolleyi]
MADHSAHQGADDSARNKSFRTPQSLFPTQSIGAPPTFSFSSVDLTSRTTAGETSHSWSFSPLTRPRSSSSFTDQKFYTPKNFFDPKAILPAPRSSSGSFTKSPSTPPQAAFVFSHGGSGSASSSAAASPNSASPTPAYRTHSEPALHQSLGALTLSPPRMRTPMSTGVSPGYPAGRSEVVPAAKAERDLLGSPVTLHPAANSLPAQDSRASSAPPTRTSAPVLGNVKQPVSSKSQAKPTPTRAPYDPAVEISAQAFPSPDLQSKLRAGQQLLRDISACIEQVMPQVPGSDAAELKKLLENSRKLENFQPSETRTIAVLGDSGCGKSSLINSLLHYPGISDTSDLGEACTSFVTEYRYRRPGQTTPICIEVDYLSAAEISTLVSELVWSYRQFFLPSSEDKNLNSEGESRHFQRQAEHAWSALKAAFGHRREFNGAFLKGMLTDALIELPSVDAVQQESARIAKQLIQWTKDIKWPEGAEAGHWSASATSAADCRQKTKLFSEDRVWPFTKIIRIFLDAQLLESGIVVADLPGTQDTNLARVQATERYMMHCDCVLVVADISRAITDKSLETSLFQAMDKHGSVGTGPSAGKSNVIVVCTKSDIINEAKAQEEFCGHGKMISPEVWQAAQQNFQSAAGFDASQEYETPRRRQKTLLMQARNTHVKEGLRNAYQERVPGGHLPVFCVSNTSYERYATLGLAELVQASEIPQLRQSCHSVSADAQLSEVYHFLQSQVPQVLNGLALWFAKEQSRDRLVSQQVVLYGGDAKQLLDRAPAQARDTIGDFRSTFQAYFRERIHSRMVTQSDEWRIAAQKRGAKWAREYHNTQYNAWCKNDGKHQTVMCDFADWNAEIIDGMVNDLELAWDDLERKSLERFESLESSLTLQLQDLGNATYPHTPKAMVPALKSSVDFVVQELERILKIRLEQFSTTTRFIRRCLTETNSASFIYQEMHPAYRQAASQCRKGMHGRQIGIVQGKLMDDRIFDKMLTELSSAIHALLTLTQTSLQKDVDNLVGEAVSVLRTAIDVRPRTQPSESGEETRRKARVAGILHQQLALLRQKHQNIVMGLAV